MLEQSNTGQTRTQTRPPQSRMDISTLRHQILFHIKDLQVNEIWTGFAQAAARAKSLQIKTGKAKAAVTDVLTNGPEEQNKRSSTNRNWALGN